MLFANGKDNPILFLQVETTAVSKAVPAPKLRLPLQRFLFIDIEGELVINILLPEPLAFAQLIRLFIPLFLSLSCFCFIFWIDEVNLRALAALLRINKAYGDVDVVPVVVLVVVASLL